MATPYFWWVTAYVFFRHGILIPCPVIPYRPQSVGVAEDQRKKVYNHPMAGTYNRKWKLKVLMTNTDSANYNFSDLVTFIESTVVWAKKAFTFYDNAGNGYVVRLLNYSYEQIEADKWDVTINLEEEYT